MTTENTFIDPCSQDNDVGPFTCLKYTLIKDCKGREKKLKLTVRDRDIVVCVSFDDSAVRVLHLQCVRDNTVAMAQVAIEELFEELKSLDNSNNTQPKRMAQIEREDVADMVHQEFYSFITVQAEKCGLEFEWMEGGYTRGILRAIGDQIYLEVRLREGGAWYTKSGRLHGVASREFEAKEQAKRKGSKKRQKGPPREEKSDTNLQAGEGNDI